jgi:hypothetical protein
MPLSVIGYLLFGSFAPVSCFKIFYDFYGFNDLNGLND